MRSVLSAGHHDASQSAPAVNTSHTLAQLREAAEDVRATAELNPPELLCGMYRVGALIRHGATGTVHYGDVLAAAWARGAPSADDDETGPRVDLVLKLEEESARKQQMVNEWRVYEALRQRQTDAAADPNHKGLSSGFPVARFGRHEPTPTSSTPQACALHVLAMEALGPDLGALLASRQPGAAAAANATTSAPSSSSSSASTQPNGSASPPSPPRGLSLKTVLSLGEQVVSLLERLHAAGFCHRDLKPENLVVGRGVAANKLHLLDFGVACPLAVPEPSDSRDGNTIGDGGAGEAINNCGKSDGIGDVHSSGAGDYGVKESDNVSEHADAAVADFLSTYAGKADSGNSGINASGNHATIEAATAQDGTSGHTSQATVELNSGVPVPVKRAQLVGSVRYLSEKAHGHEGAPPGSYGKTAADDLESAGFVLAYLFRGGRLPWQGLLPPSAPLAARNEAVKQTKRECASNGWTSLECPAIAEYLTLVRTMASSSTAGSSIDYSALRNVFTSWRKRRGIRNDGELEWTTTSSSSSPQQAHMTSPPALALSADSSSGGGGSGTAGSDIRHNNGGDGGLLSLYAEMPKAFELSKSGLPPALPPPSSSVPPFAPPSPTLQPVKSALKRKRNDINNDINDVPENSKNKTGSADSAPTTTSQSEDDGRGARLLLAKRARRVHWPSIRSRLHISNSNTEAAYAAAAAFSPSPLAAAVSSEVSACFELEGLGPPSDAAFAILNGPHAVSAASTQSSDAAASVAEDALLSRWKAALTKSSSSATIASGNTPEQTPPNGSSTASDSGNGGKSSGNSGVDPVAALVKIVPHLRSDKKAAKALSLLAALLRAHVPPADPRLGEANKPTFDSSNSNGRRAIDHKALALEFHGALAVAMGESRRVHDPSLRSHYAALLTAVFGSAPGSEGPGIGSGGGANGSGQGSRRAMSYFWPSQLRGDVALWCIAGWVFNATCAPPASSSSSSSSQQQPQAQEAQSNISETFPVLVPVLSACVKVLLEGTSGATSAPRANASAVSSSTTEMYKVRLFDVLQRLYDRFREPWTTMAYRDQCIEVFEVVLALPGSWWPTPTGKAKRNQVERWASSMAARR